MTKYSSEVRYAYNRSQRRTFSYSANRWLHSEIGTAVQAASAVFDPATFDWHVSIELVYGAIGPLGPLGDVYLHAATGDFAGCPSADEFRQRAELLSG